MSEFKAPLKDIRFVRNEVLDFPSVWSKLPGCEEATPEIVDAILDELGKFCENELAPLNAIGDQQGCTLSDGEVTTPEGFKEAYQLFVESGWPTLVGSLEMGGQGLPISMGMLLNELLGTANWSWSMYPLLSHGARAALEAHGSEELKAIFLPRLCDGRWTGTMCLTEPHCGTDLGLLRTKAEPQTDEPLDSPGTSYRNLIIFRKLFHTENSDNILQFFISLQYLLHLSGDGIMLFTYNPRVKNSGCRIKGVNGWINTQFSDLT